ncbi:MAG: RNHCP domain-containing protein [Candidatus Shapirobacteria bacterium]
MLLNYITEGQINVPAMYNIITSGITSAAILMKDQRLNFITRKSEPYVCEHCGIRVIGGRNNNHCPACLWSKHVDDQVPGDRASSCQGLMKPIGVTAGKKGTWRIVQKCTKCDHIFTVDTSPEDDFKVIVGLSQGGRLSSGKSLKHRVKKLELGSPGESSKRPASEPKTGPESG